MSFKSVFRMRPTYARACVLLCMRMENSLCVEAGAAEGMPSYLPSVRNRRECSGDSTWVCTGFAGVVDEVVREEGRERGRERESGSGREADSEQERGLCVCARARVHTSGMIYITFLKGVDERGV